MNVLNSLKYINRNVLLEKKNGKIYVDIKHQQARSFFLENRFFTSKRAFHDIKIWTNRHDFALIKAKNVA